MCKRSPFHFVWCLLVLVFAVVSSHFFFFISFSFFLLGIQYLKNFFSFLTHTFFVFNFILTYLFYSLRPKGGTFSMWSGDCLLTFGYELDKPSCFFVGLSSSLFLSLSLISEWKKQKVHKLHVTCTHSFIFTHPHSPLVGFPFFFLLQYCNRPWYDKSSQYWL